MLSDNGYTGNEAWSCAVDAVKIGSCAMIGRVGFKLFSQIVDRSLAVASKSGSSILSNLTFDISNYIVERIRKNKISYRTIQQWQEGQLP